MKSNKEDQSEPMYNKADEKYNEDNDSFINKISPKGKPARFFDSSGYYFSVISILLTIFIFFQQVGYNKKLEGQNPLNLNVKATSCTSKFVRYDDTDFNISPTYLSYSKNGLSGKIYGIYIASFDKSGLSLIDITDDDIPFLIIGDEKNYHGIGEIRNSMSTKKSDCMTEGEDFVSEGFKQYKKIQVMISSPYAQEFGTMRFHVAFKSFDSSYQVYTVILYPLNGSFNNNEIEYKPLIIGVSELYDPILENKIREESNTKVEWNETLINDIEAERKMIADKLSNK